MHLRVCTHISVVSSLLEQCGMTLSYSLDIRKAYKILGGGGGACVWPICLILTLWLALQLIPKTKHCKKISEKYRVYYVDKLYFWQRDRQFTLIGHARRGLVQDTKKFFYSAPLPPPPSPLLDLSFTHVEKRCTILYCYYQL
jgi:hypothetical protein